MRLRYARLSTAGPVRPVNEDSLDFWESPDPLTRETQGGVALLADGVGGYEHGEIASRLAVEIALKEFQSEPGATKPYTLLRRMFTAACSSVHENSVAQFQGQRMATTLVASIFRDGAAYVANVGDTRAYFIRQKTIRRLTTDHVVTSVPVKLGLLLERQAMASPRRSELTRSLGSEPFCQPDFATQLVHHGDFVLQCTDGLHAFVLDEEMREIVARSHAYDACKELVALAGKRGSDDNISLQLIEVRNLEQVAQSARVALGAGTPPKKAAVEIAAAVAGTGDLGPGMLLDGRFELTDLIARSNMASIFRANDRTTGQSVAVKVPLMTLESDVAGFERFRREEEIGAQLSHPSILKVIKVDGPKSRPYLVMEFLEGKTLSEMLAKRKALSEGEAVSFAIKICDALEYLHTNGIAHRDLKPQNIMVCSDGGIRLFDFGIARVEKARRLTFVGLTPTLGTPDYISPEQVRGKRGDHRSDIYSLGAILYEMVTGSTPFEGESPYVVMNARVTGDPEAPRKINPELNPAVEEVILHAMERDPRMRYQSGVEMKSDLENLDKVEVTHRDQRLRAPQPWKSRSTTALLVAGFILLQIALFVVIFLLARRHR
jgi:serine/threonine protein phosphatase PrpC